MMGLELYYNDFSRYPEAVTPGQGILSPDGTTIYMLVPSNPGPRTDKGCPDQDYIYTFKSPSEYNIQFCIGMDVGEIKAGNRIASPTGIK